MEKPYRSDGQTPWSGLIVAAGRLQWTIGTESGVGDSQFYGTGKLFHVSRGVRWDSDYVVSLDEPTKDMLAEVAQSGAMERIAIGMDFFDASISRIAGGRGGDQ